MGLAEAKEFMPAYAPAMVQAARELAEGLRVSGVETIPKNARHETHQVLLPCGTVGQARALSGALEASGILVGVNRLPPGREHCLRFGTQIVARRSYSVAALRRLGSIIATILAEGPDDRLRAQVRDLSRAFSSIGYAFPP